MQTEEPDRRRRNPKGSAAPGGAIHAGIVSLPLLPSMLLLRPASIINEELPEKSYLACCRRKNFEEEGGTLGSAVNLFAGEPSISACSRPSSDRLPLHRPSPVVLQLRSRAPTCMANFAATTRRRHAPPPSPPCLHRPAEFHLVSIIQLQ